MTLGREEVCTVAAQCTWRLRRAVGRIDHGRLARAQLRRCSWPAGKGMRRISQVGESCCEDAVGDAPPFVVKSLCPGCQIAANDSKGRSK